MSNVQINTRFDAGSIDVKDISDNENLHFTISKDSNSDFAQWFYFQITNVKDKPLNISIDELDQSSFPEAWKDYNVCASYDNQYWFRIPSQFADNSLRWSVTPESSSIYFAYFEPYPYSRHVELINRANTMANGRLSVLGKTAGGRNIDLLVVGNENASIKIWIIARQNSGATMAEWFMEGLIHRMADQLDPIATQLLNSCVFYLVPNMNPDGTYLGNLSTNSSGSNLKNAWLDPSQEKTPEVFHVRNKMLETGADLFFDIHGTEALPYVFSNVGSEHYSPKQARLAATFEQMFPLINPDYQTKNGYAKGKFKAETATISTSWAGTQFDCLAFTIEMPFKDNANLPDLQHGWNGQRSYLLGQSLLTGINVVIQQFD